MRGRGWMSKGRGGAGEEGDGRCKRRIGAVLEGDDIGRGHW